MTIWWSGMMFPLKAVQAEGHERENVFSHLQTALMTEFQSLKSNCNYSGFQTKRRSSLLSLNQNMKTSTHFISVSPLNLNLMNSWVWEPLWFSMPSSVLSLISEGQSPPHAFSSASPKQGAHTRFNTLGSLYTTDSQTAAVMYIPQQLLPERAIQGFYWRD